MKPVVDAWAKKAGYVEKVKRGHAAPDPTAVMRGLLSTLHTIPFLHMASLGLAPTAAGAALKKAYFKVVRKVHPDKVSPQASAEEKLACQRVFAVLSAAYVKFKG